MNIELRHLRYFVAVAEELHFGRAARRLAISQPPLSQQIQQLEAFTGGRLFTRTNRSVALTPAGEQFLLDARQILSQVEDAILRASRLHQGQTGELKMGFTSSVPFIKSVFESLSAFRYLYPDVHIDMREMNTREQIPPLQGGELELGLMRNTTLPDTLDYLPLLQEPLRVLVHRSHPLAQHPVISLPELAQEPFVFFDARVGTGLYDSILGLLKRHQVTPYITQEVGEAMTIISLVSAGLGISILPSSFQRVCLSEVVWLPVKQADALSELWLVWSKHRALSAPARQIVTLLTASLGSRNILIQE